MLMIIIGILSMCFYQVNLFRKAKISNVVDTCIIKVQHLLLYVCMCLSTVDFYSIYKLKYTFLILETIAYPDYFRLFCFDS